MYYTDTIVYTVLPLSFIQRNSSCTRDLENTCSRYSLFSSFASLICCCKHFADSTLNVVILISLPYTSNFLRVYWRVETQNEVFVQFQVDIFIPTNENFPSVATCEIDLKFLRTHVRILRLMYL